MHIDGKGCLTILIGLAIIGLVIGLIAYAVGFIERLTILWFTIGVPVGLFGIFFALLVVSAFRQNVNRWLKKRKDEKRGIR